MKTLTKYLTEKLIINKNYSIPYNYHPNNEDELRDAIQEHYDNDIYDLNDIDVSKITNFSYIFNDDQNTGHKDFNISKWDVRNGKDFSWMFSDCHNFNCNLSEWDVSNGVNFSWMFINCSNFNSNLSKWKVNNGKDFIEMFAYCKKFNSNLSNWNIKDNSNTESMFYNCNIDNKNKPKGIK